MRWILLALVATTLLYAAPVGSSKLLMIDHKDYLIYGNDESDTVTIVPKAEIAIRSKVSILTEVLKKHTSGKDAEKTAKRYCYKSDDPELWVAMDITESNGKSNAVSPVGAQGRLQVMPSWKTKKGFEFYRGRFSHLNDDLNFRAAQLILNDNLQQYHGNKWLAVERYCGTGTDARDYVAKIKRLYKEIKAETHSASVRNVPINQASILQINSTLASSK